MFCSQFKEALAQEELANKQKQSILDALDRSQAIIEFDLDGNILHANENFLAATGYSLDEIVSRHHRMFVPDSISESEEYKEFWQKLKSGEFVSGRFKRKNKKGDELWLEASYNPIYDQSGAPHKIIKFATDITDQVTKEFDYEGQIEAINKTMAVIQFDLEGNILMANDNFLKTSGYSLDEIKGKHHSLFVTPEYKGSSDYQQFWEELGRGHSKAGTFHRMNKSGQDIWLEASYNPILDDAGKPFKVVKFAVDVSQNENTRLLKEVIHDAGKVFQGYANGDFTIRMKDHLAGNEDSMFKSEVESLTTSITDMISKLSKVIADALHSSSTVNTSAIEVKDGAMNLSQRVQEQAASLEETSATMDEMNSSVQNNRESASLAVSEAKKVQVQAGDGEEIMRKTVEAIHAIEESSHQIKDIVSLIDSIAFQTNLLALNAAVEAARAGEHGRGFAVVAGEVRALAQKSADAAKEINNLIAKSSDRVVQGVELARESGESLESINAAIKGIVDMVDHIASASEEQASGISQVHQAINQIDTVTQQNAALVEEASASSEAMQGEAEKLSGNMRFFKI